MKKPLIFISHITSEKEIALALKELVNKAFIGMAEVFVSSDPDSIAMGGKWLEEITHALKGSAVELVLASPNSIKRPWINFEAGAGWVRDIPVVPICHSGMTYKTLPSPLSSLQSGIATDLESMGYVISVLAKAIGCTEPSVDFGPFIEKVEKFQETSYQIAELTSVYDFDESSSLSELESETLIALAEETDSPEDWVSPYCLSNAMQKNGYRKIASNLGMQSLKRRGLVEISLQPSGNIDEEMPKVQVNSNGWMWLNENQDKIILKDPSKSSPATEDMPF